MCCGFQCGARRRGCAGRLRIVSRSLWRAQRRAAAGKRLSSISVFIQRLVDKLPLKIHGTGNQQRDFVYVDDAVAFLRTGMAWLTWRALSVPLRGLIRRLNSSLGERATSTRRSAIRPVRTRPWPCEPLPRWKKACSALFAKTLTSSHHVRRRKLSRLRLCAALLASAEATRTTNAKLCSCAITS
jgi:NAD dependent epimerase/dehydratase family